MRILLLFILITNASILFAQGDVFTSYDIFKMKHIGEVAISPDGKQIAYTIATGRDFSEKSGPSRKELFVLDVASGETKSHYKKDKSFHHLSWTPDSKSLTFLAKWFKEKKTQIYTFDLSTDSATQITHSKTSIEDYDWNPNNSSIAYISTIRDTSRNKWIKKGFNAEIYEEEVPEKNLYLYDFATKSTTRLTKGIAAYTCQWNPAGDLIAAKISEKNLIDYQYMFSKIQIINPKTKEVTILVNNPGKLGGLAWAPDGKRIAFISGVDVNDPVSGSLYVAKVPNKKDFTQLTNYSQDFEGSVTHVEWRDAKTLIFSADESVDVTLNMRSIDNDKNIPLVEGGTLVFRGFHLNNGTVSISGNTNTNPGDLYTMSLKDKKLVKRTDINPWVAKKQLGKQEKLSYTSRDGMKIEGVLIYPVGYKAGTTYPLINYIHGGPESCVKNGWSTAYSMWGQVAAGKGYFVYMPNYRGSSGRGVAFSKADQGDMGDEEFNDVLDGIDHLINKGMVDKSRVGIGGGSYGGYFSGWAATKHTNRFAAAVSFVGISDQVSKRFTTDIPYESYFSHWTFWTHEQFELVFDRSPVKYAKGSKTATLILHGKEDPRVHPSQSLELYRALKLHGKAPVRLVWYPGEGHGNRKNPARLDYNLRTFEWFDYYLKSEKVKSEKPSKDLDYGVEIE
ncbi:MAG: S9 family peptidase [Flavobacteriales bacterium]|nr:S9 family peptidase [Flavobacteriales bacterium]